MNDKALKLQWGILILFGILLFAVYIIDHTNLLGLTPIETQFPIALLMTFMFCLLVVESLLVYFLEFKDDAIECERVKNEHP